MVNWHEIIKKAFRRIVLNDIETKGFCQFSINNLMKMTHYKIPSFMFEWILEDQIKQIEKEKGIKLKLERKGDLLIVSKF